MLINGKNFRTIWFDEQEIINIIDQRHLPFKLVIEKIYSLKQMIKAIQDMHLRGAGLIGVAGAYGTYLALKECRNDKNKLENCINDLKNARPTAVNLIWAVNKVLLEIENIKNIDEKILKACSIAKEIAEKDIEMCRKIGTHGFNIIKNLFQLNPNRPVNILTHCNAGWLAFIDIGSATAPIYKAKENEIPVHVWVDETRPRNQGAFLTAWELYYNNISHTVISDNTGGHLMQKGLVDLVIVGTDRTTRNGDVANKIGTYLKALAAKDNSVPFYVALPTSSIDWTIEDGISKINIEQRSSDEVKYIDGIDDYGEIKRILITNPESNAINYAFDVTPSRLVTGFITEYGVCSPIDDGLFKLFQKNQI